MKHASVDRAKRVSNGCRNNGTCQWCIRSRTWQWIKLRAKAREELRAQ